MNLNRTSRVESTAEIIRGNKVSPPPHPSGAVSLASARRRDSYRSCESVNEAARSTSLHSQLSPEQNYPPTNPTSTTTSKTGTAMTKLSEYCTEPSNSLTYVATCGNILRRIANFYLKMKAFCLDCLDEIFSGI